jgi:quinol monooxygenase YgiN
MPLPHVSITGLRLNSRWHAPRFWWHALRSMAQARRTPGCLMADARSVGGVQHTLSVWQDRAALGAFMTSAAHRAAMQDFRRIATGRTYGYESDSAPDWSEALVLLRDKGRDH